MAFVTELTFVDLLFPITCLIILLALCIAVIRLLWRLGSK